MNALKRLLMAVVFSLLFAGQVIAAPDILRLPERADLIMCATNKSTGNVYCVLDVSFYGSTKASALSDCEWYKEASGGRMGNDKNFYGTMFCALNQEAKK
jgi:hypothetical protein